MKIKAFATGAILLCLLTLPGCSNALPCGEVPVTVIRCPPVSPCRLPPASPRTNGALLAAYEDTLLAWHDCAARVDLIHACQTESEAPK